MMNSISPSPAPRFAGTLEYNQTTIKNHLTQNRINGSKRADKLFDALEKRRPEIEALPDGVSVHVYEPFSYNPYGNPIEATVQVGDEQILLSEVKKTYPNGEIIVKSVRKFVKDVMRTLQDMVADAEDKGLVKNNSIQVTNPDRIYKGLPLDPAPDGA